MCNRYILTPGKINLIRAAVREATYHALWNHVSVSIIYQPIWKQYANSSYIYSLSGIVGPTHRI